MGPTVIISGPALEAYFSLSPEAMCIVDRDGTLVAANTACDELFGTLPGDLPGRPLTTLFAADFDCAELLAGLDGPGRRESLNSHFRVRLPGGTGDGTSVPLDLSLIPLLESLTPMTLAVIRPASEPVRANNSTAAATMAARDVISGQRELLVEISNGHGVGGIARALHRRTRRPVLILDPLGQVLADAGYEDAARIPPGHLVSGQAHAPHGVRERIDQSWTVAACPDRRLLGRISIFDPDNDLPEQALCAVEHATSILASELLRYAALSGDGTMILSEITQMLLDGRTPETGSPEASLLGADLDAPHLAIVVDTPPGREDAVDLVSHAARSAGVKHPLVTLRDGRSVLVAPEEPQWEQFMSALSTSLGGRLHIGVGESYELGMIARSVEEAVLALKLGTPLGTDAPVRKFHELGVWRILVDSSEITKLRQLVQEWIAPLIQHDTLHNSELVKTLTTYLKESGTADTAAHLHVHRNTLRYRLSKIALITGRELADPDERFQLEFACRGWLVLQALENA